MDSFQVRRAAAFLCSTGGHLALLLPQGPPRSSPFPAAGSQTARQVRCRSRLDRELLEVDNTASRFATSLLTAVTLPAPCRWARQMLLGGSPSEGSLASPGKVFPSSFAPGAEAGPCSASSRRGPTPLCSFIAAPPPQEAQRRKHRRARRGTRTKGHFSQKLLVGFFPPF